EGRRRAPPAASPLFLRNPVLGFGHEDRIILQFPALGVHPGGRPRGASPEDIPPVRSVRYHPPGSVPGEVPGGRRDPGPYLGERGLSVAVPSVLEERDTACLGDRREHLSDRRHLPG